VGVSGLSGFATSGAAAAPVQPVRPLSFAALQRCKHFEIGGDLKTKGAY
jgi:hypothetical protein